MIEVEYLYINKTGQVTKHCAYFHRADKALRFMFKCSKSKNLVFAGDYSCTDPLDFEYINKRWK